MAVSLLQLTCDLDVIGLLHMAYPNGCRHKLILLSWLRPYPVKGHWGFNSTTTHISMSTKDDLDTQQGNDSFNLVELRYIRSYWDGHGRINATVFVSYMSEVKSSM